MFKCQLCGTQVPRGTPQHKLITQRRPQIYSQEWTRAPNTPANKLRPWRELPRSKSGGKRHGKPRFIEVLIPKHTGWEIAEEKTVCPRCAKHPAAPPIPPKYFAIEWNPLPPKTAARTSPPSQSRRLAGGFNRRVPSHT
ncbi:MAG: hypothetical protein ACTHN5_14890 [Phycisphaerae bacterium]